MTFFKIIFFKKKSFGNTIRVSDGLDPDQAGQNVRPDLGLNCLQRLSTDDKVMAGRQAGKELIIYFLLHKFYC